MTFSPRRALIGFIIIVLGAMIALWLLTPRVISTNQSSSPVLHVIHLVSPAGNSLTLHVEFARTEQERMAGLMNRQTIGNDGMLFLFDHPQELSFWMKNTLMPLDVLFFDGDGAFVSVQEMQPCTTDPCSFYASNGQAQEALEVPIGFAREHGIGKGWKLMVQ
ncbi:DUF192 domain-containing protein [Candidatus Peregrinibacteria bacterium]|nr:DUF192 domain-containing protein [Candidatus Peregrinibacteria bacterium]